MEGEPLGNNVCIPLSTGRFRMGELIHGNRSVMPWRAGGFQRLRIRFQFFPRGLIRMSFPGMSRCLYRS